MGCAAGLYGALVSVLQEPEIAVPMILASSAAHISSRRELGYVTLFYKFKKFWVTSFSHERTTKFCKVGPLSWCDRLLALSKESSKNARRS